MLQNHICVVHLVRKHNGPEVLSRFISTYRTHDAGINHQLLLVFKGFDVLDDLSGYRDILFGLDFKEWRMPDIGYDIDAYMSVFQAFRHEYRHFCFLNSFSEILHPHWLEHL